jgi:Ni/Co efflux regulator RcnB
MLRKLILSVALVAGSLGAVALTTSSADAAYPRTSRQSHRVQGRHQRARGWNAHARYRHHGHRGVSRGRYQARYRR